MLQIYKKKVKKEYTEANFSLFSFHFSLCSFSPPAVPRLPTPSPASRLRLPGASPRTLQSFKISTRISSPGSVSPVPTSTGRFTGPIRVSILTPQTAAFPSRLPPSCFSVARKAPMRRSELSSIPIPLTLLFATPPPSSSIPRTACRAGAFSAPARSAISIFSVFTIPSATVGTSPGLRSSGRSTIP